MVKYTAFGWIDKAFQAKKLMANYKIKGTYKVEISRQSLALAVQYYGWADDWLTETGELKEEIWLWYMNDRAEEKDTIALIEAHIMGAYSDNELNGFRHGPTEQAPYLEFYLDETGTEKLSYEKAVAKISRRFCFFLHFVDISQPILITQGKKIVQSLQLLAIEELPERIKSLCFYIPYD